MIYIKFTKELLFVLFLLTLFLLTFRRLENAMHFILNPDSNLAGISVVSPHKLCFPWFHFWLILLFFDRDFINPYQHEMTRREEKIAFSLPGNGKPHCNHSVTDRNIFYPTSQNFHPISCFSPQSAFVQGFYPSIGV